MSGRIQKVAVGSEALGAAFEPPNSACWTGSLSKRHESVYKEGTQVCRQVVGGQVGYELLISSFSPVQTPELRDSDLSAVSEPARGGSRSARRSRLKAQTTPAFPEQSLPTPSGPDSNPKQLGGRVTPEQRPQPRCRGCRRPLQAPQVFQSRSGRAIMCPQEMCLLSGSGWWPPSGAPPPRAGPCTASLWC